MLDPIWLRSFVAVAELQSFTEAATRAGIRQSTVSEHVRKLEAACGKRLFARDTHSVEITTDGEAMLGFARSILDVNERAMRHFAQGDMRGNIRLGASEDVVLSGLPLVLKQFMDAHPQVELELTVGVSETLRSKLDSGKLDIVLQKRLESEARGTLVWRDPLIWASAPDFRFAPDRPIPLVVLAPPAITRTIALAALENSGCHWRVICSSDSQSGVYAALRAGLGIAPHAKCLLPPDLTIVRAKVLPDLGATEFVIVRRKGAHSTPLEALYSILLNSRMLRRSHRTRLSED